METATKDDISKLQSQIERQKNFIGIAFILMIVIVIWTYNIVY